LGVPLGYSINLPPLCATAYLTFLSWSVSSYWRVDANSENCFTEYFTPRYHRTVAKAWRAGWLPIQGAKRKREHYQIMVMDQVTLYKPKARLGVRWTHYCS